MSRRNGARASGPAAWLLRAIALLVPASGRQRWLEEWRAELGALQARRSAGSGFAFALGALPHSLWERKEWIMTVLLQDVRFALRVLARSPVFTALAVLTVAVGVGASTTIFTLVNATLLQPPGGIRSADELVQIGRANNGGFDNWAYPYVRAFEEGVDSLAGVTAYTHRTFLVGRGADTEVHAGALVSGNYFELLGVTPQVGRLLGPDDDTAPGANPVAVISARLWRERYGGDSEIVGGDLHVNGRDYTIVGVADPAFHGTDVVAPPNEVWLPLSMAPDALGESYADSFDRPGHSWLWVIGRRAPGATLEQIAAESSGTYRALYVEAWGEETDGRALVVAGPGLRPEEREYLATLTALLLTVVAVVLVVASANLGNLMLARARARLRELGVRVALGASRGRLIRQLVTESLILALAGGMLAVVATFWTARLLPSFLPWSLGVAFRPDLTVLGFGLMCAGLAGALFGLLPALRVSRGEVTDALREGARQISGGGHWLRRGLVVGQLALSFLLLVTAGLLVQSVLASRNADPGYRTRDVLAANMHLDLAGLRETEGRELQRQLVERARSLPNVEAAATGSETPFAGWSRESLMLPEPPADGRPFVQLDASSVSPGYFETLGIPVLRGTAFPADAPEPQPNELVLSESAARILFPEGGAVGATIEQPAPPLPGQEEPRTRIIRITGVVADVHNRSLRDAPNPSLYTPTTARYSGRTTLFLRASESPEALTRSVRELLAELDPRVALLSVDTLHDRMGRSLSDTLLVGRLAGVFGGLALLLATVGLYGVVAYLASRRTHEVGIRMALGASRSSVLRLVVRQGLALGVVGVAIGALLAIPATGVLRSLLYGVSPRDPLVMVGAAVVLIAIAVLASALPARRATRVDPASALRVD